MVPEVMTKPRISVTRELMGILGNVPHSSTLQKKWNAYFLKEGIDAFVDKYPTTPQLIPKRLSEMFHFDRRWYIVSSELSQAILEYMDQLDTSASSSGRINFVLNKNGIFIGYFLEETVVSLIQKICAKLLNKSTA